MLCKLIKQAQNGDRDALEVLIDKFYPLLKKYASKLNYEDAFAEIILYYIELIKSFDMDGLVCQKDEGIVSYINVSVKIFITKKYEI